MGCEIEVKPLHGAVKATAKIETGSEVPEAQRTIDTKHIIEELQGLIRRVTEDKNGTLQMTFAKYPTGEFYIFKMIKR